MTGGYGTTVVKSILATFPIFNTEERNTTNISRVSTNQQFFLKCSFGVVNKMRRKLTKIWFSNAMRTIYLFTAKTITATVRTYQFTYNFHYRSSVVTQIVGFAFDW